MYLFGENNSVYMLENYFKYIFIQILIISLYGTYGVHANFSLFGTSDNL